MPSAFSLTFFPLGNVPVHESSHFITKFGGCYKITESSLSFCIWFTFFYFTKEAQRKGMWEGCSHWVEDALEDASCQWSEAIQDGFLNNRT